MNMRNPSELNILQTPNEIFTALKWRWYVLKEQKNKASNLEDACYFGAKMEEIEMFCDLMGCPKEMWKVDYMSPAWGKVPLSPGIADRLNKKG